MLVNVLRIAGIALLAYLVVATLVWKYQDKLAFPAPRRTLPPPTALGFPNGERVSLRTDDGVTLHGWYLPPDSGNTATPAPGLIWFYGNMETVAALAPVLRALRPSDTGLLALDYRGYGESGGSPTEAGLYRDADAAWAYLTARPEIDETRIGVYGRSLGSAVALYLATRQPVRAVVLDSPFSSARDMAREHYWLFPRFLLRHSMDNVARARQLQVPLMVFHGTDDRIAPVGMGRTVAEVGRARELVLIEAAGHNDTYDRGGAEYREKMASFLRETLH